MVLVEKHIINISFNMYLIYSILIAVLLGTVFEEKFLNKIKIEI